MKDDLGLHFPAAWPDEVREFFRSLDAERQDWLRSLGESLDTMQPFVDNCEQLRVLDDVIDAVYAVIDGETRVVKAVRVEWPGPPPSEAERWRVVRDVRGDQGYWWRRPRATWAGDAIGETFSADVFDAFPRVALEDFNRRWRTARVD